MLRFGLGVLFVLMAVMLAVDLLLERMQPTEEEERRMQEFERMKLMGTLR